jgi:hypothetical protein
LQSAFIVDEVSNIVKEVSDNHFVIHYLKIEDRYVVNLVDAQVNNGLISFL